MGRGHISRHGTGYRVRVYAGLDPVTGKQRQVSKVVHGGLREAEAELAKLLAHTNGISPATGGKTFGELLDAWLEHKALFVEPTTLDGYRIHASYIPDRLRNLPLRKLDVEQLETFYAYLAVRGAKRQPSANSGLPANGLGPKAVENIHGVIQGALEFARRRGWIAANPARDTERPKGFKRLPSPVPVEKLGAVFAAAETEHELLPTYLRLTLAVGGRISEIHGLRWSGVDFQHGLITLRDVVVALRGYGHIVKPRTKTGQQRIVHIDAGTVEALRRMEARAFGIALECGMALPSDGFVFTDSPTGATFWNPKTTRSRFQRACAAAGLPKTTRPHDLRHLMATHLIDKGVSIATVSGRLGHSRNSTTLDIYTARIPRSDEHAAEVIGELLDASLMDARIGG